MRCQVWGCNRRAIWERTSITPATKMFLCGSCRKRLEKEFDIKGYYYKLIVDKMED